MHGFDCILCHCPGSKCDKRTACRGGTIGEGREGQEETKQDKRFGQLVMNPKKHITVQRMATPKHTEPPSLVSTRRKNTTRRTVTLSHEHSDRRIKLPPKRLDYVVSWWNSQRDYIHIKCTQIHTERLWFGKICKICQHQRGVWYISNCAFIAHLLGKKKFMANCLC